MERVERHPLFRPCRIACPLSVRGHFRGVQGSLPCLCPAPRPRPSRQNLAFGGLADTATELTRSKASAGPRSRGWTQGSSIRCLRFTNNVAIADDVQPTLFFRDAGWRTKGGTTCAAPGVNRFALLVTLSHDISPFAASFSDSLGQCISSSLTEV